jgi:hypothetical protein
MYDAHEDRDQDGNIPLLNRPSSQRLSTQIDEDEPIVDDHRSELYSTAGTQAVQDSQKCRVSAKIYLFKLVILITHVDSSTKPWPRQHRSKETARVWWKPHRAQIHSSLSCYLHDFKDDGFTLRRIHYDPPRHTELFIAMTTYDKDKELFT